MTHIAIKRVYDKPSKDDGFRVLVDRLWPRGLTKHEAKVDLWLRPIAPTPETRRTFGHDVSKWDAFVDRYNAELEENVEAVDDLREAIKGKKKVTLVYGAADTEHNNAVVLRQFMERRLPAPAKNGVRRRVAPRKFEPPGLGI